MKARKSKMYSMYSRKLNKISWHGLGFLVSILLWPTLTYAERIGLNNGKIIEGEIIKKTDEYLMMGSGSTTYRIPIRILNAQSKALIKALKPIEKIDADSNQLPTQLSDAQPRSLPPSRDPRDIYKNISPAIISITAQTIDGEIVQGSGFIVDPSGVIVTNNHVVNAASAIEVQLKDGRIFPVVSVINCNPETNYDYCILKINAQDLPAAPLADSDKLQIGEKIYCIGNPLGLDYSLSDGLLAGIRDLEGAKWIQFTAPISPGNSGGPIINSDGQVIGITTFLLRLGQNLNFALAINEIKHSMLAPPRMTIEDFANNYRQEDYFSALTQNLPAQGSGISGIYAITHATNPSNQSSYSGNVAIIPDQSAYRIAWKFTGSPGYKGVGLLIDKTLCVGWSEGGFYGVVVYKVKRGKLYGQWTDSHLTGQIGTEELEGPPSLNGVYTITKSYSPQGGGSYRGTVDINKRGEVYSLTWHLSNEEYSGVGILKGDLLIVGWGNSNNVGVVYYDIKNTGELKGRWAIPGTWDIGIENLLKN